MDFRTRRQLAVIIVVGAIVVAGGIGVYTRFAPKPTCVDNRKNQNEEETDCGGPCIPCAFKHQQAIEVFWTRVVQVRPNSYDVASEIRNPNVKLGAVSFNYTFSLYDDAGVIVAERRGQSFIYPGETMHLEEIGLVANHIARRAELAIGEVQWVLANASLPDVAAGSREVSIENESGVRRSVVKAVVTNRTLADVTDLSVGVAVFDGDGNLVGVNRTVIDALPAGGSVPVIFTWPSVFLSDVSSSTPIIIEARSPAGLPNAPQ